MKLFSGLEIPDVDAEVVVYLPVLNLENLVFHTPIISSGFSSCHFYLHLIVHGGWP